MKSNVNVRILDIDFDLVCDIEEREILERSAKLFNDSIKEFHFKNPSLDREKLIMMAALKLTCEQETKLNKFQVQIKEANNEIKKAFEKSQQKTD